MRSKPTQIRIFSKLSEKFPHIFGDFNRDLSTFNITQLKSKRNDVYEVKFTKPLEDLPENFILKIFKTPNGNKEVATLKHLKKLDISVPLILLYENPYLILEKINGENLCDFINENLLGKQDLNEVSEPITTQLNMSIKLLAQWFAEFHRKNIIKHEEVEKIIVLNKGDTQLRDFIINFSSNSLYGLDFENAYEGNFLEDLSWVCCSLIDTNPGIFELSEPSHKIKLINIFLKEYFRINNEFLFSFQKFAELLIENLNVIIKRRGLRVGNLDKNEILNKIFKMNNL
jgi:hypothetical protein